MATVYLTIGPPAAGKTTFVSWQLVAPGLVPSTHVVNPDALLFGADGYHWTPERVGRAWAACRADFTRLLATGRPIALDATFVRRRDRKPYLKAAAAAGYDAIAVAFDVPPETLVARDRGREDAGKRVGVTIIHKFFMALEPPHPDEGFAEIWRVDASGERIDSP